MEADLLIRTRDRAVAIADGKIVALEECPAREVIDAGDLLLLPGVIDSHVHFNEPGRAEWEGLSTGSQACAAGGTTTFFDMPLNSTPPVLDAASFQAKRALAEQKSHVDFALWGGLTPLNLDQLGELKECGAIALKAFMSGSGIDDFPKADPATLRAGMKQASALGLIVGVHAEIDHPEYARGSSVRDYLASRPISMELEAIKLITDLAGETGCALHIVHVSSAAGVRLVAETKARGVDVTCETGPHYLVLNEDDVERLGAVAKCAPPIRSEAERLALLEQVAAGTVQMIGSDHSPAPPSMKTDSDFFKIWGGISGCQHLLALLFGLDLARQIPALISTNAAARFRLAPRKGFTLGADADLVLVDPRTEHSITREELLYRHQQSPYIGKTAAKIVRTFLRGETIYHDGRIVGPPRGRFLSPTP